MPPVISIDAAPAPDRARQAEVQETPIFAAPDGRRRRRMRIFAGVAAGVLTLWLVALVAGMLGFGRLPAVGDLGAVGGQEAPKATPAKSWSAGAFRGSTIAGAVSTSNSKTAGSGRTASPSSGGATSQARPFTSRPTGGSGPATGPRRGAASPQSSQPSPAATSSPAPTSAPTTAPHPGRRVGQTRDTSTGTTPAPSQPGPSSTALEHRQSDEHAGSKQP